MNKGSQVLSLEEAVLELYSSLKSEISSVPVDMQQLKNVNIVQIVDYLRQSIEIVINHRMERKIKNKNSSMLINDDSGHEKLIKKLENEIRQHIKIENEMKLHLDYLEDKIEQFSELKKEIKIKNTSAELVRYKDEDIKKLKSIIEQKERIINELNNKLTVYEDMEKSSRNNKSKKYNHRSVSLLEGTINKSGKKDKSKNQVSRVSSFNNIKNVHINYYSTIKLDKENVVKIENPGLKNLGKHILNAHQHKILPGLHRDKIENNLNNNKEVKVEEIKFQKIKSTLQKPETQNLQNNYLIQSKGNNSHQPFSGSLSNRVSLNKFIISQIKKEKNKKYLRIREPSASL